jgi:hypothetical protein
MSKDKGSRAEKKAPARSKKEKKAAKAAKRAGKNKINIGDVE